MYFCHLHNRGFPKIITLTKHNALPTKRYVRRSASRSQVPDCFYTSNIMIIEIETKHLVNPPNIKHYIRSPLLWHPANLSLVTLWPPIGIDVQRIHFCYKLIPNTSTKPHHFWHFQPFIYKFWGVLIFHIFKRSTRHKILNGRISA